MHTFEDKRKQYSTHSRLAYLEALVVDEPLLEAVAGGRPIELLAPQHGPRRIVQPDVCVHLSLLVVPVAVVGQVVRLGVDHPPHGGLAHQVGAQPDGVDLHTSTVQCSKVQYTSTDFDLHTWSLANLVSCTPRGFHTR